MRSLWIGCLGLFVAFPVLAEAGDENNPLLQFLFGWFPLILIVGMWYYFMRRMGARKMGHQIDRSLEHMDKLEQQNEEILETLQRIERHLRT